jgi:rare lipoprotein A
MKLLLAVLALAVSGCAAVSRTETAPPAPAPSKGAYYKDDGPGDNPPANLASIPDAVPRAEPLHRFANRPYEALGRQYVPMTSPAPFRQSGVASWYGRRFNGQPTSSGEKYDMYAMSAAHPTLPIPSYARVTNAANGRSVVVRVNDRGPFHADRIIDLSYAAAYRLGYADAGSARVEVEAVLPGAAPVAVTGVTPVAAAAPAEQARVESASGIYLQLGAFSSREAAESFRARLYGQLAWLSDAMQVVAGGNLYRLHLGPYRTPEAARAISDRIQSELSLRPVIVSR